MASRATLFAIALLIVAAGVVALVLKFWPGAARVTDSASPGPAPANTVASTAPENSASGNSAPQDEAIPPTSETLIAEALAAKDITYEESLRQRAYAIFDDPRLQLSFRTSIVNWEAMGPLLAEVADNEATLSAELLDDLLPFRVRPNDPRSIVNRPRAEVLKTQPTPPPPPWLGRPVPGTGLMVWIRGTEADLQKYIVMASRVWRAFPAFFTHPLPDLPGREVGLWNPRAVNPNNLVDVFLIDRTEADPRRGDQSLEARGGAAWVRVDPEKERSPRASGYALVGYQGKGDDELYNLIAHELAHVSQLSYDTTEATTPGAEGWMMESTAEWVAYKVMTALAIRPAPSYRMIDRREPAAAGRPTWPQPPLFNNLHKQLHRTGNDYSGFIFFYSASLDLGDGIVKQVWQQASPRGAQGIDAVNQAIPLVDHFPLFTVRNWNRDPVLKQYKDRDGTFSRALQPEPVRNMPDDLGTFELSDPVVNLSARYYRFTWSGPRVKKVTFQNFYKDLPNAHVWAIKQIGTDWKEPEDWSRQEQVELCRESPQENVTELVLIVSDSDPRQPIKAKTNPRLLVEDVGCEFIEGSAQSTLRLRGEGTDVTYVSSRARLRFKPRMVQDTPGKVDYDLMPTSVTWTVSGTRAGCRLSGQALITIPAYLDQDLDPTRPAWGFMAVIGKDGGDFHSVQVSAADPNARVTETCPGDPPQIRQVGLDAAWLLHAIYQKNTHQNGSAVFKGPQTLDAARIQDNIPVGPGQALQTLQGFSGTAPFMTPEVQRALKEAQAAMERSARENSGKLVYTFDWELKPMSGTPPSP